MNRTLMLSAWVTAVLALSCATVPPPVTDDPDSPARPSADQAPWDPEFRYLETAADAESASHDAKGHEHDRMKHDPVTSAADGPTGTEESYVCALHPEVKEKDPGACPICAATLEPSRSPQSGGGG